MHPRFVLCLTPLAFASGVEPESEVSESPRPDVAIVLIDTLRQDHLDLYGGARR